jgi:hypothetical protein
VGCDGSGLVNCVTCVKGIKNKAENRANKCRLYYILME